MTLSACQLFSPEPPTPLPFADTLPRRNFPADIPKHPFTGGKGKTEVLKYDSSKSSKRLTHADRLVYSYNATVITIYSCRGRGKSNFDPVFLYINFSGSACSHLREKLTTRFMLQY